MRIRTICAGVALVVVALLTPSAIQAVLLLTECTAMFNGVPSCGDPGAPLAKGAGLLREAVGSPIPEEQFVRDVKLADVDGDGALDAVESTFGFIEVRRGDGHGGFGSPIVSPSTGGDYLAVGDMNGDGRPDVALLNTGPSDRIVEVLLGAGNGTFTSSAIIPSSEFIAARGIAIADVTGDNVPDVVAMSNSSGFFSRFNVVDVFAGDGNGALAPSIRSVAPVFLAPGTGSIQTTAFAVADVNGDGDLDVLNNSDGVAVWYGHGSGSFELPVTVGAPSAFLHGIGSSISTADLNGDGRTDIVQFDGNQLRVILNTTTGFSTSIYQAVPEFAVAYSTSMALADIDGDGAVDAVAMVAGSIDSPQPGPHVSLLFGDGAGGFSNPSFYPVGNDRRLTTGDANGDGRPDVVAFGSSELTILLHASGVEIGSLSAAVDALHLPAGTANSLHAKLKAAAASRERGNLKATANQLNAFINHVDALNQSGKLTAAQASSLIAVTQQVIAGL